MKSCKKWRWKIQAKKKDLAVWETIATTDNLALEELYYKTACENFKHVRVIEKDYRGMRVKRLKGVK